MEPNATSVEIAELRAAVAQLLDAAERRFGPRVELDADYYWWIDSVAAFDMNSEPRLEAGQLSDDVTSIRELLGRTEVFLWHDLAHLVGVLTRLASLDRPDRAG